MTHPIRLPALLVLPALLAATACNGGDDGEDGDGGASPADVCIDEDLGSSVEFDLATADSEGDDYQIIDCNGAQVGTDGEDYGWTWVAPATTGYTFSTVGSDFDTVLVLHDSGCEGPVLGCNDDGSADVDTSEVYVLLEEGQEVVIVVDGYDAYESGTIQLHVLQDM
ncbi:hypothetical protein L6R53_22680 [Myxococcota bacterium]|nr:hypothetical protein [Myxococcota bacterium]